MPETSSPNCAQLSRELGESPVATASRVDHWIVIEYRRAWGHEVLPGSRFSDQAKEYLHAQVANRKRTKLVFVRQRERGIGTGQWVFWGSTTPDGPQFYARHILYPNAIVDIDFTRPGSPLDHPLILVCTHGKHDRCCARLGRPVYDELREQIAGQVVWQSSHLGGDRFAANVLVLPEGLYYGRVTPETASSLYEDYGRRQIHLENYRGRCCYGFATQAAERAVREHTRMLGIDDLRLGTIEHGDGVWHITFEAGRAGYEVEVVAREGEPAYLTCDSVKLSRPPRYDARILRGPDV